MRQCLLLACLLIAASACATSEFVAPTSAPSATAEPSIPTATAVPTATSTPPATLEAAQAAYAIQTMLREPMDCAAPCFWGIMPGKTTAAEAKNIFTRFRLPIWSTTNDGKDFYEVGYSLKGQYALNVNISVQNNVVQGVRVFITPSSWKPNAPRAWSAFSPDSLITRYGTPSHVDFFVGRAEPGTFYVMNLRFNARELIVSYAADVAKVGRFRVCPLTDAQEDIRAWFGKDAVYPPAEVVPLEEATSLSLAEFANLMTGSPYKACVVPNLEKFP